MTAERLLRLLSLFTVRRSWGGDELAQRLGVTPRTIRRDVERLRELGYQVRAVPGPYGGYELGAGTGLPPLLLDDDAAVAVAVGLRAVAGGAVAGMEEAAVRAAAVIERVLPGRLKVRADALRAAVVPLPGVRPDDAAVRPETLALLALACRDGERIRFGYTDGEGTQSSRHVEPFRLVVTARRWYLVAHDLDKGEWRSFRLDRLERPQPTGQRSRPADPPRRGALRRRGHRGGRLPVPGQGPGGGAGRRRRGPDPRPRRGGRGGQRVRVPGHQRVELPGHDRAALRGARPAVHAAGAARTARAVRCAVQAAR